MFNDDKYEEIEASIMLLIGIIGTILFFHIM
nr:MAG TPA: hypothetical protein [Caudoviricetes sp.]